jgi:hypothetical protein
VLGLHSPPLHNLSMSNAVQAHRLGHRTHRACMPSSFAPSCTDVTELTLRLGSVAKGEEVANRGMYAPAPVRQTLRRASAAEDPLNKPCC